MAPWIPLTTPILGLSMLFFQISHRAQNFAVRLLCQEFEFRAVVLNGVPSEKLRAPEGMPKCFL